MNFVQTIDWNCSTSLDSRLQYDIRSSWHEEKWEVSKFRGGIAFQVVTKHMTRLLLFKVKCLLVYTVNKRSPSFECFICLYNTSRVNHRSETEETYRSIK